MSEDTLSRVLDAQTGAEARVTDFHGDQVTASRTLLLNETCEGSSLETKRLVKNEVGAGTVSQASGLITLNAGTVSGDRCEFDTAMRFGPPMGTAILLRAILRYVGAPDANNTREVGFRDAAETTKIFFELGTALNFRAENVGAQTASKSSGGIITPSAAEFFQLDVMYSRQIARAWLSAAGETPTPAGSIVLAGESSLLLGSNVFHAYMRSKNTGTAAVAQQIEVAEFSISLLGDLSRGPVRPCEHTGGGDGQILRGPGMLWKAIRYDDNGETFNVVDGSSASGKKVLDDTYFDAGGDELELNTYFADGLYWDTTGGGGNDSVAFFVRGLG